MPLLELQDVSVAYGEVQALRHVSLHVNPGEIAALCGSNGAGKTTTLRAAMGLVPAAAGRIVLDGRDVTAAVDARVTRGVALVPEGRQLFAGLSVRDNLLMGAYTRLDRREVAADFAFVLDHFPELSPFLRRQAGTLSGGRQQMVAVARALMARPRLLLIDGLSAGLAPIIVDRLVDLIVRIHREAGLTILLVEQDLGLAFTVAQRVYVLESGRVIRSGPAADLRNETEIRRAYLGI